MQTQISINGNWFSYIYTLCCVKNIINMVTKSHVTHNCDAAVIILIISNRFQAYTYANSNLHIQDTTLSFKRNRLRPFLPIVSTKILGNPVMVNSSSPPYFNHKLTY